MQTAERKCPICDAPKAFAQKYNCLLDDNTIIPMTFYHCPICGKYELKLQPSEPIDSNRFACYLAYHRFSIEDSSEERYHTELDKDVCDKLKCNPENGRPVHIDTQIVENWYPNTFANRIDYILLYINSHIKHIGQSVAFQYDEMLSILFIDRWTSETHRLGPDSNYREKRRTDECEYEICYMLNYLKKCEYIEYTLDSDCHISLMPKGYERIDVLQKNMSTSKNAFVAMQFGDETMLLREAIRKGISQSGYNAIFIDEIQHNNLITPEIMKYIRESKFVVVDLTHKNNGAYFEEGYAMGIGKPIIQLCRKREELHFDIAQINTIFWANEDEIPERLKNRILATID